MKRIRRGLAVTLAALLMIPAQPTLAVPSGSDREQKEWKGDSLATPSDLENGSFGDEIPDEDELWKDVVEDNDLQKDETPDEDEDLKDKEIPEEDGEIPEEDDVASPSDLEKTPAEEIRFNTGNHEVSVVSYEDFFDRELGDAYFEEDGSYTIQIPEENPFFPYEVQFTSGGTVTKEWFMTPEDSVEIDDHIFYVSAFFDDTVVTQMTLDVAGDTVVVYPEAKEFTDGDGISPLSLLPLEERSLSADLRGYTPVELTMVSIDSIFAGNENLAGKSVMWSLEGEDDYIINHAGDKIDLSVDPWTDSALWEMIVGEESQLADGNIRYLLDMTVTSSEDWLVPTVYKQDDEGKRTEVSVLDGFYEAFNDGVHHSMERYLYIDLPGSETKDVDSVYVNLDMNSDQFAAVRYADIKFFNGFFENPADAESAADITAQIFGNKDMTQPDAGYAVSVDSSKDITAVTYDQNGNITGCLLFSIEVYGSESWVSMRLYEQTETGMSGVSDRSHRAELDGVTEWTETLRYGYPVDGDYYLVATYYRDDTNAFSCVTAAYVGHYDTIAQARAAGAKDIKDELFGDGYKANYSAGVPFTFFVGEDSREDQEVYRYLFRAEEGSLQLDSSVSFEIYNLCDENGIDLIDSSCVIDKHEDSYAQYNYLTIFADETVDLEHLTLSFGIPREAELYTEGSSEPVVARKTILDFSDGPVQFTVSAEDKENSFNYWVQVIGVPDSGAAGALYINSLADKEAETTRQDGVIYSVREIFLDGYHDDVHDILIANVGSESLSDLTVELESEVAKLDDYWTLNGGYDLAGFTGIETSDYGELPNLAKIRILPKAGMRGQDVSGTLTIKSGETLLAVLTLTGSVGDPMIITEEIPEAVKYVPYGTMIQNSNKYNWNTVSYRLLRGELPEGMEVRKNGELYGVPMESGEFRFSVRMDNSASGFGSYSRTYTLIVKENTDRNVNASTDPGYEVTQRIPDITLASTEDHTFVSQGLYGQFVDVFLDGVKLVEGQDYDSESGSTRITIRSQTLKASNQTGTHTLGVEFRTEDRTLKRAAQNYRVTGSGSSGGGGGSVTVSTGNGSLTRDAKKGYVNSVTGIVTGEGEGYSKWQQDETGWRLIYADGTAAAGYMAEQADGNSVEQVLWEKVNGSWYAFGANGYLKSGWVWDYELAAWYSLSVDSGMRSSWYTDTQDGCTYYMDPSTGKMVIGWKLIDGKWYYFNETTPVQTWFYNAESGAWVYNVNSGARPFGSMYQNEWTPDHYHVGADGAWEE